MKDCGFSKEKLSAYLDGAVSPAEKMEIERHIERCVACREQLVGLEVVIRNVKKLGESEPPEWLAQRVMSKVREEAVPGKSIFERLFVPFHIKIPLEALAMVFVAVVSVYMFRAVMPDVQQGQLPEERSIPAPAPLPAVNEKSVRGQEPGPPALPQPEKQAPESSQPDTTTPAAVDKTAKPGAEQQLEKGGYAFAPSPAAIKPPAEQVHEKKELTVAGERMAESAGAAAPAAGAAKRMKRESPPAPALQADKAATAVRQADEEMALRVADPDLITAQVIKLIERNDGKVTDLRQAAGTRIIHVELDASRLEALVKEFGKLGSVERIRKAAGSVGRITMKLTLGSKQ